jgi:hypothetical protein
MVHRGEQRRFAAKAVDALVVVGEGFGKDLDRDVALEVLIVVLNWAASIAKR